MDNEEQNILQKQAQAWALRVVDLHNTEVPNELKVEKAALLSFAQKIKQSVEAIIGAVPELDPMNQLGLFFVPVAIVGVAAAAAAMAKWTIDAKMLIYKTNDRNSLISAGMSPEAAIAVVNQGESQNTLTSVSANIKKSVAYGGVVIGLYMLAKKMGYI